ncbi:hypothetical protein Ddye_031684 [Dipteronia dyeriana]|uniref:RNase H type-1 domain-containing protein n=1 Tax=Dipteronia dyeriana TaxID=168575 RepID=A0AAD9TIU7_9ROSI|nr:hypothetical protein Ddye_031684 [Dipteronia dyeriana]
MITTSINTDGTVLSSPCATGCGGVFRNRRAFVNGCFAAPLDHVFASEAELLAASMTINFTWQNGWHRICLESDSSYVVQLLSSRSEQIAALTAQKRRPNPLEAAEESDNLLFFNDDFVSESVIVDFDQPLIFDKEMSDDDSKSSKNLMSSEYNSQELAAFHHRERMMNLQIQGLILSNPKRMMWINPRQKDNWRDGL